MVLSVVSVEKFSQTTLLVTSSVTLVLLDNVSPLPGIYISTRFSEQAVFTPKVLSGKF